MEPEEIETTDEDNAGGAADGSEDYSHLFRRERGVADVDLRVDVAENFSRFVTGNEEFQVDVDEAVAGADMNFSRGAYTNTIAGAYLRTASWVDFLAGGGWAEADVARAAVVRASGGGSNEA